MHAYVLTLASICDGVKWMTFRTMPSEYYLSFFIGIFAGTMTGLMGASGMMAVVPGIILLGYSAYQAIGVSLAVDVIASAIVAVAYYRHGRVDLSRGLWIAVAAIGGAQLGSRLIFRIPETGLSGGFGVILIVTAIFFWRDGIGYGGVGPAIDRFQTSRIGEWLATYPRFVSVLLGLIVGVISGMFGVGGGIIFLFALLMLGYRLHVAVGTSTLIMALTTFSGAIGHAMMGNLPYMVVIFAAAGTVLGSVVSARFANRMNEQMLSKAIAVVFAILGGMLLFITIWQQ